MAVIITVLFILLGLVLWGLYLLTRSFFRPSTRTRARRYEAYHRRQAKEKALNAKLLAEIKRREAQRAQ